MSELANKLQAKIKTYKKQIEEAEEIAALNLAKFRKAQQELEETEDRTKMAEAQLSLARGGRGASVVSSAFPPIKNPSCLTSYSFADVNNSRHRKVEPI